MLEAAPNDQAGVFDEPQHSDDRTRIDRPFRTLIVKADVPAGHGSLQRRASVADSSDRLLELPEHLRFLWITEVQAICYRNRPCSHAGNVSCALGYCDLCPPIGIQKDIPWIAIGLEGDRPAASINSDDGGIGAPRHDGVISDHRVVLCRDPAP